MAQSTDPPKRIWASLITNLDYLPGLLTLSYSLHATKTQYPFVAFYTSTFPPEGLAALQARGIRTQLVPNLQPVQSKTYAHDPRFQETWTKLVVFSLVQYERVVLLDGDMLVRRNMDELMDVELDGPEGQGQGERVFAASHACACNPLKKGHYPETWIPSNCAFTTQHPSPSDAQTYGASSTTGIRMLNSGLLVAIPSTSTFSTIKNVMNDPTRTEHYSFPDQELLSDAFAGRWVPLPYVYNALKTMRWEGVHDRIWRDESVKNVHYIFARKPWHEDPPVDREGEEGMEGMEETHRWWWRVNLERKRGEREGGILDGY